MTLKEPPIQIRKRLSEYASWPGADRYEWHYGDLQRGQFYDHYDVSIKPLKTGSLAILREETGPIVELARNLGLLYERTYRTTDKKAICTIPKELTDVLKTCQIKQISRQGSLLTALDLSFTMGFGKVIAPEEKYLYYHSPICPVVVVEPVQTTR
ncbi:hypothetical protein [Deinococcus sp.]|uniref:hypothetical protein n=1 Tax=Deinococcus sp. TaxID=47478 RepID=UPI0025BA3C7A|nr:hypothetical protein [Deinococcus sp.]